MHTLIMVREEGCRELARLRGYAIGVNEEDVTVVEDDGLERLTPEQLRKVLDHLRACARELEEQLAERDAEGSRVGARILKLAERRP